MITFYEKFASSSEAQQWAEDVNRNGLSHDDVEDVMRNMGEVYDQLAQAGIAPPSTIEGAAVAALLSLAFEIICDADDDRSNLAHDQSELTVSYL